MRYFLVFLLWPLFQQAQNVPLEIKVEGISEVKGKLMYRIVNEKGKVVRKGIFPVDEQTEIIPLKLPKGNYAIAIFHDANDNDKLDRAFTGIPTEFYGFSNNARGMFGPPDLEDQLFSLETKKQIKVRLQWKALGFCS